jgi:hypothetical protein
VVGNISEHASSGLGIYVACWLMKVDNEDGGLLYYRQLVQ